MKKLIIGFAILVNIVGIINAVTIQTSDGQEFEIPFELAQQIPTINNLLEDIEPGEAIPLPTITGPIFSDIIELLKIKNEEDEKGIIVDWESKFKNFDVNKLIQLVNACDYLNLELLESELFKNLLGRTLSSENRDAITYSVVQEFWIKHPAYNFIMSYTNSLVSVSSVNLNYHLREFVSEGVENIFWYNWKVLLTPDESKLISWISDNNKITVWNAKNLNAILYELEHVGLQEVIMSPDGTKLISAAWEDGTIKVWDLSDLNKKPFALVHKGLRFITLSYNSKLLISSSDHIINIWNLNNLQQDPKTIKIEEFMYEPQIAPDSTKLITLVYNDESSSESESSEEEMQEESESEDFIKIWDIKNLNQAPYTLIPTRGAYTLEISPDSSTLMAWGNGIINVWDLSDLTKKAQEIVYGPQNGPIPYKITFSPDSKKIVMLIGKDVARETIVEVWDATKVFHKSSQKTLSDIVIGVIVSPDSKQLVTWGTNIQIWDINDLENPLYELPYEYVEKPIITPDSKLISLSASFLKIWNMKSLDQMPLELKNDTKYAAGIIASPHMNQIVAWFAENNGIIKIWDFSLLNKLKNLSGARIGLITWLYENKDNKKAELSSDQFNTYLSLPLNFQRLLHNLFPVLKSPIMEEVEELPMEGERAPGTTGKTTKEKKSWWSQFLSRLRLGGPN